MKTQNVGKIVDSELAIFKIEKIIKLTSPNILDDRVNHFFSKDSYETLSNEVRLIIKSLSEGRLMPKYKLSDIADYANKTNGILAKTIIEIDFFNEISTISDISVLRKIQDIAEYYTKAYKEATKKIDGICQQKVVATYIHKIPELESIAHNCPAQYPADKIILDMLILYYKIEVNKLPKRADVKDYLYQIKDRGVYLSSSKCGNDFLLYCEERCYKLDIEQSTTPEEVLKIRKTILKKITLESYEDLISSSDDKLANFTDNENNKTLSIDKVMKTYKYLTQSSQKLSLLSRCLLEIQDGIDTSFYWFIYQELLLNSQKKTKNIILAKDKLVQAFQDRTSVNDSFQEVCNIFQEPCRKGPDKVSQNLAGNKTVMKIITDRISRATIIELKQSIAIFCNSHNNKIYYALIKRFFILNPDINDILDFEKDLISIRYFMADIANILKLFYDKANSAIITIAAENDLTDLEIKNCFAIVKYNPACKEAKKQLIQKMAKR